MTGNQKGLKYFSGVAAENPFPAATKLVPGNDFSAMDVAFVMKYAHKNSSILDIGSGSGFLVNKIYDKVRSVTAVEYFKEFSKFIVKAENVEVINCDLMTYTDLRRYDIITMFGIMHYFDDAEAAKAYSLYRNNLRGGGTLLVKNQFGIEKDVIIDGYSEELKKDYFSVYRQLDKEISILENAGYLNIAVHDIYPPECSRWPDTHFYALEARAW